MVVIAGYVIFNYTYSERVGLMGELKYRKNKTFSVKIELLEKLKKLSDETRIPQSRLVDEALEDLLKKHGKG